MTRPPLYGLDLLTETVVPASAGSTRTPSGAHGDEPRHIRAVGLSLDGCERRFAGDEARLLGDLDAFLAELPPGVLVTWHGAVADLAVLAARTADLGVVTGLRVRPDARSGLAPVGPGAVLEPAPAWCGAWHDHRHLDLARVYQEPEPRGFWYRRDGVPEDLIPAADEETGHDPRHDAHLARCLAERRWSRARRLVDRMPPVPGSGPRLAPWSAARASARTIA